MKIIEKSVDMSLKLVNPSLSMYQHFSFVYIRNKLLAIGQNETDRTNYKSMKLAKRFRAVKPLQFPYIHAETDAISKLWGKVYLCHRHTLVSIRLNRHGELRVSKPCVDCSQVIDGLNLTCIYFDGKTFVYA